MEQPHPRHLELTEMALGSQFFSAAENQATVENSTERLFYTTVLRGLAKVRRADRRALGVAFDRESWQPLPEDLSDLQQTFEPLAARLAITESLADFVHAYQADSTATVLRKHQRDAVDDFLSFMERVTTETPQVLPGGHAETVTDHLTKSGYFELPTASGKTVLQVQIAQALGVGTSGNADERFRVLLLEPTQKLVRQTIKKGFQAFAPHIAATPYYEAEKDLSGDAVVMTYRSFLEASEAGLLDEHDFGLFVLNEGHRALGSRISAAIRDYRRGRITLNFTASPNLTQTKTVQQEYPTRIHHGELCDYMDRGIINGVELYGFTTNQTIQLENYRRGDFTDAQLRHLLESNLRNRYILEIAEAWTGEGLQGIVSCIPGDNCRHARELAEALNGRPHPLREHPIRAEAVGDFRSDTKNEELLEAYEAGEIDVLFFVNMLSEGWDSDNVGFMVLGAPTGAEWLARQRFGRGLRSNPNRPLTKIGELIDLVKGGRKRQVTAWHLLGLERIEQGRVVGSERAKRWHRRQQKSVQKSQSLLPPDIQLAADQIDKVLLKELIINPELPPPPEGWKSVPDLLELAPLLHYNLIVQLLSEHFQPVTARGKNGLPTLHYPPEAEAVVLARQQVIADRKPTEEGMLTKRGIVRKTGASSWMVSRAIEILGYQPVERRGQSGRFDLFYTADQIRQIKAHLEQLDVAAGTDIRFKDLAAELGVDHKLLTGFFAEKGVTIAEKYIPEGEKGAGSLSRYITEDQAAIARLDPELPLPHHLPAWLTADQIAELLGVSRKPILTSIDRHGLRSHAMNCRAVRDPQTGKLVRSPARYYPPQAVEAITHDIQAKAGPRLLGAILRHLHDAPRFTAQETVEPGLESAPKGWVDVADFLTAQRCTPEAFRRLSNEARLPQNSIQYHGKVGAWLMPDYAAKAMKVECQLVNVAENGWSPLSDVPKALQASVADVTRVLKDIAPGTQGIAVFRSQETNEITLHASPTLLEQLRRRLPLAS